MVQGCKIVQSGTERESLSYVSPSDSLLILNKEPQPDSFWQAWNVNFLFQETLVDCWSGGYHRLDTNRPLLFRWSDALLVSELLETKKGIIDVKAYKEFSTLSLSYFFKVKFAENCKMSRSGEVFKIWEGYYTDCQFQIVRACWLIYLSHAKCEWGWLVA